MESTFLIEAFQAPGQYAEKLGQFFETLEPDPYLESNCRFRAFSRYRKSEQGIERLDGNNFMQSSDVNRLIGDVERSFEHISPELEQQAEFQYLLNAFIERTGIDSEKTPIGVHQIRVTCSCDLSGSPAPEGIHQDGFNFVGIFCVRRENVRGGYTQIFSAPVDQHPHLSSTLEENQFIILNDKRYFHYVSEIQPADKQQPGVRDVFVLTA
ncbi:2OG-Fe dioxygenase family protein [Dongshaea marina]|uniref:2OG-Fe dioxygenase family protein n=1 Tax=Dongshaea marina TaxID=2047966 RepID=UPI000D3E523E|nr:2OG-Fe dioxygenase family protein [Dongshaea marina]